MGAEHWAAVIVPDAIKLIKTPRRRLRHLDALPLQVWRTRVNWQPSDEEGSLLRVIRYYRPRSKNSSQHDMEHHRALLQHLRKRQLSTPRDWRSSFSLLIQTLMLCSCWCAGQAPPKANTCIPEYWHCDHSTKLKLDQALAP